MYFGHFFSVDDILQLIERVDADQVIEMARSLFHPEAVAVTLLGRLDGLKLTRKQLDC